ncbi:MAG: LytTR family transcriptional regulator [Lachnospiraceae bacterium]|nr:LytTR family transcriptional regulator [Lachnospiraceae bacterium]
MKVKIEIDPNLTESEIIIKCSKIDDEILNIQSSLLNSENEKKKIVFYQDDVEYYLSLEEILFFEANDNDVWAHTPDDSFKVKYKLYELESTLPKDFLRISKSTILNIKKVYSINRNLSGASKVQFNGTPKSVYVSRNYFKLLKEKLSLEIGT